MTKGFQSHKVGELPTATTVGQQDLQANESQLALAGQPYHLKFEVHPLTNRPQSHYSRATQQQIVTADIIREQTVLNSQSSRLIGRPHSGARSGTLTLQRQQTSANTQTLGGIASDGHGKATLVTAPTGPSASTTKARN